MFSDFSPVRLIILKVMVQEHGEGMSSIWLQTLTWTQGCAD